MKSIFLSFLTTYAFVFVWLVTLDAPTMLAQSANSQIAPPPYNESDLLPGKTMLEKLNGVSQLDLLGDTTRDAERCSCAAGLNAYLLLGGAWKPLAKKFNLSTDFTYESVHRLQDRLYDIANVDDEPGIFGGCRPRYNEQKRVIGWERKQGDEAHLVFEQLGLDTWPLYGPTEAKLNDRKPAVLAYFRQHPQGALIVGANEDMKTGESLPVKAGTFANHYILVLRRSGVFYRLDSWAKPGQKTLHKMTEEQVRTLVFESPITLLATKLMPRQKRATR